MVVTIFHFLFMSKISSLNWVQKYVCIELLLGCEQVLIVIYFISAAVINWCKGSFKLGQGK